MDNNFKNPLELQDALKYEFNDPELLRRALIHRSFIHERQGGKVEDNETLEFLGDSVLGLAVSHILLRSFPQYNEGDLSRMRSAIVNERQLAEIARTLDLGTFLQLGKGEELTGGRDKQSLLADCLEALLGAIYLDGGLDSAIEVVTNLFDDYLDPGHPRRSWAKLEKDYKTLLQEAIQAEYKMTPEYVQVAEEGPDHDKVFHFDVLLDGKVLASGTGKSKKQAQQRAAERALADLEPASGESAEPPGHE